MLETLPVKQRGSISDEKYPVFQVIFLYGQRKVGTQAQ